MTFVLFLVVLIIPLALLRAILGAPNTPPDGFGVFAARLGLTALAVVRRGRRVVVAPMEVGE